MNRIYIISLPIIQFLVGVFSLLYIVKALVSGIFSMSITFAAVISITGFVMCIRNIIKLKKMIAINYHTLVSSLVSISYNSSAGTS